MIGEQIKKRRLELGRTQEELAKRMGYKSNTTINKIELGIEDKARIEERISVMLESEKYQ